MPSAPASRDDELGSLLESLRAEPSRAAVLTDVDGTLAPIVERAADARVPERARELLERLAGRYAVVGCISGRRATDARRLVGVGGIAYAGNHGLELLAPGETEPRPDPSLDGAAGRFLAGLESGRLEAAGLRVEDKGPIQALHWRGAADEAAAEREAEAIGAAGEAAGLRLHRGRKVLELRPDAAIGKDLAVEALLRDSGVAAAIYAGDDLTDADAFRRLRELRDGGDLERAGCVAVASAESPPGLAAAADFTVDGPAGWLAALEALAA